MRAYEFTTPLRTERLTLRLMTMDDVDAVHAYHSLPDVTRYMLFDARDREAVIAKVTEMSAHTTLAVDGDYLQLAVVRTDDDRLIGDLYFSLKSVANDTAEIGWCFSPEVHGQGYATEGARELVRFAFENVGMRRLVAELDPRNGPSAALCTRLGMRLEGTFVEDMFYKGEWGDTAWYGLLDRDWRAA